jgi:Sigma-70 region 2
MAQTRRIAEDQQIGEFDQFYPRISRYALKLLHDPSDAQDATQDTFLRAALRHELLRDPAAAPLAVQHRDARLPGPAASTLTPSSARVNSRA